MHDIDKMVFFLQCIAKNLQTLRRPSLVFDSTEISKDPMAMGLRNCFLQLNFPAITWMLMDIITIVTQFNLLFQRERIDVTFLKSTVSNTISKLLYLKIFSGHNKTGFFWGGNCG